MLETRLIDSVADAETLASDLAGVPLVAMDTEFVRERTYYPRPCLLQLAWDDRIACVDLLHLPDTGPLDDLLYGGDTLKVFHAARQDLELFYSISGRVPAPVYDTQVAGGLVGFPGDVPLHCVASLPGVRAQQVRGHDGGLRRE